jgi:hypothetical protein
MIWVGHLEKLFKVIHRLPRLALEIALGGGDVFLTEVVNLLVVVIFVRASGNCNPLGCRFGPHLLSLVLLLAPLPTALGGASSPEVCRVAMSSNSFLVFG